MTSDDTTTSSDGQPHERHRLAPRERLAAAYERRWGSPAVSAYALAVRAVIEDCPEIGPIDTWSKLSERICRDRPDRKRDVWRKKLSRHFTTETKGPPWLTVETVVRYVVPESDRQAKLGHFKRLHDAARGDRSTSQGREPSARIVPEADGSPVAAPAVGTPAAHAPGVHSLLRKNASLRGEVTDSRAESAGREADLRARNGHGRTRHRPLDGETPAGEIPRQRKQPAPGGPLRKGCNPGRFTHGSTVSQYLPTGSVTNNDAPASRRGPFRVDLVWPAPGPDVPVPGHRLAPFRTSTHHPPSAISGNDCRG